MRTKSTLKIKTFDSSVMTGVKPAGVLVDELHEMAKSADAARVIGQVRGGMIPMPESFLIFITTQSDEPPVGVFRTELNKARSIRDGEAPGNMLPVLYEFPSEVQKSRTVGGTPDWYDSSTWWMVTPNRDRSISIARLEEEFATARRTGMEEVVRWASQHLNIEIGLGLRTDRWGGADYWMDAAEDGLTLQALISRSEVIVVGIDGGGQDDLLGMAVLGRETGTRRWLHWGRAWMHEKVLDLRKSEAAVFGDLVAAGDLVICNNMEAAFSDLAGEIAAIDETGLLAKVGLDPMGIGAIVDALAEHGIVGPDRVVGIAQGWTLNGAIKTAEIKLANGTLTHCGQPIMAYAVGNAKAEPKGNAITITKQLAGTAKIDPLMALFNAVALMTLNPEPKFTRSVYEDRGILFL